jgi:hypothetical protein
MPTVRRQDVNVCPIIPGARTSEYLYGWWEQGNKLCIPTSHLPSGVPKRAEDGIEISPFFLFQCLHKLRSLALGVGGPNDVEFRQEPVVDFCIVLYWISEVENQIFLFADHTEKLKVQELNVRSTLSDPHDLRMAFFKVLK